MMPLVYQLESMAGFPQSDAGLRSLAKSIYELCGPDTVRGQWLIDRIRKGSIRIPAPIEMRRVYCQKHPPADGLEDNQVDISDHLQYANSGKRGEYN
jgi:hypothetical protein